MMRVQVDELSEQLVKAQAQSNTQSMQETKARTAQAACARKVCYPSSTREDCIQYIGEGPAK